MSGLTAELIKVSKLYKRPAETITALRDATVQVNSGQLTSVFGASGSGKSTLLNILAGLDVADSGSAIILGYDFGTLSEDARADIRLSQIGVIFQSHNLLAELTVVENMTLSGKVLGRADRELKVEATDLLELVGLAGVGSRFPRNLSGGQQQRVGVARALMGGRPMIIADEPTGSLDSGTSRSLCLLLSKIAERGAAVVVATHDPLVADFSNRTYYMTDGAPALTLVS